jgi:hypothetical protein
MEEEDMRQALRTRLLPGERKPAPLSGIISKPPEKKPNTYKGHRTWANLFRLRFEERAIVTYRKHIFVLFRQTWAPGLLLWILVGLLLFEIIHPVFTFQSFFTTITGGTLFIIWFLFLLAAFGWWYYQYVDWSNDIFQVTADQIMDIDKTPLGEVTSDIASLDNILSIEYERHGLVELFFNYGNVMITVGGGKQMVFEDVFNPSAVQEDIERRRLERISKKEQDRVRAERDRMADWFAAYYHNEQNIRQDEEIKNAPEPEEPAPSDNEPGLM